MLIGGEVVTTGASFNVALQGTAAGQDGLMRLWDMRLAVVGVDQTPAQWNNMMGDSRRRWRGAAAPGAGTGFRNRHWSTAFAASKHVPMPFKPNPAAEALAPKPVVVIQGVKRASCW